jgi:hypothetical protein
VPAPRYWRNFWRAVAADCTRRHMKADACLQLRLN